MKMSPVKRVVRTEGHTSGWKSNKVVIRELRDPKIIQSTEQYRRNGNEFV